MLFAIIVVFLVLTSSIYDAAPSGRNRQTDWHKRLKRSHSVPPPLRVEQNQANPKLDGRVSDSDSEFIGREQEDYMELFDDNFSDLGSELEEKLSLIDSKRKIESPVFRIIMNRAEDAADNSSQSSSSSIHSDSSSSKKSDSGSDLELQSEGSFPEYLDVEDTFNECDYCGGDCASDDCCNYPSSP